MDTRELKYYLGKAEEAKDAFSAIYNNVLEYTHATYEITDSMPINPTFARNIEPVISTSIQSFVNFLMATVFQRGQEWAEIQVNDTVYKNVNGLTMDALIDGQLEDINRQLEEGTSVSFDYINSSNYYLEITKVMNEAIVLGTCVYKYRELPDITKPFTFEYVPLDNFYFYEDENGKPNYCFRKYYGYKAADIAAIFPEATIPSQLIEDPLKGMDLIESVIPISNYGKVRYRRMLTQAGFQETLYDEEVDYNPYVVSRFNVEPNSIYGIGLGVQALETFKDLRYFKQLRKDAAEQMIKPPMKLVGDKALIHNAKFNSGSVIYGGTGAIDPKSGIPNSFMVEPILTQVSNIPTDQEILKCEQEIKDIFMSNPLGEVTDYKNRTMYETEARLNLFRNRHAATFELLQTELLEPSLILPFATLVRKGIITMNLDNVDWFNLTQVSYINELSKSKDREKRTNLYQAIEATSLSMLKAPQAGLNPKEVGKAMLDSYEIDYSIRYEDQELDKLKREIEIATALQLSGGTANDQSTAQ